MAVVVLLSAMAQAEDPQAKAAREELERQLRQMVGKQPTKVRIDVEGMDDPNYGLEEASFELDGRALRSPPLRQLSEDGTHLVWNGDVSPGKHTVGVRLLVANNSSIVVSDEGGYKWRLAGDVSFDVQAGIEVRVKVVTRRDGKQADISKRFKLGLPAEPVMIAQLDDGKMPEAPPKPVLAPPDAGPTPEQLAAEQKKAQELAAAEEKKQQAAAALEARRIAAEEKKAQAAAALEAKRLAAEEKKRLAAEAAEARRQAALEKKQQALAALEAKKAAAEEERRRKAGLPPLVPAVEAVAVPDAGVAEVIDAGLPGELDAGPPVLVAAAPPDAGVAPPAAPLQPEGDGPPWWLIGGVAGVVALAFLVVVARRRARPPTLDD